MEIITHPHIESMSGKFGRVVYRKTKNGIVGAQLQPRRTSRPTLDQQRATSFFSAATKAWSNLSQAVRDGWDQYASAYYPTDNDGEGAGPSGQAIFVKAAWYQQAAGLAIPIAAPLLAPPASPSSVDQQPANFDNELNATVGHELVSTASYLVYIEETPAMPSLARRPSVGDYRAVKGLAPDSFQALLGTGTTYTFSATRYSVPDGARFGIQATIVSPEGIPSKPFRADLIRVVA